MEEYVKEAPLAAGAKKEQVLPECFFVSFLVIDPPSWLLTLYFNDNGRQWKSLQLPKRS